MEIWKRPELLFLMILSNQANLNQTQTGVTVPLMLLKARSHLVEKKLLIYLQTLDWRPADGELYPEVLELAGEELLFLVSVLSPPPRVLPFRRGLLGACL